jgi:GT2 family glycosyltransferase
MVIVTHDNVSVLEVLDVNTNLHINFDPKPIIEVMYNVAAKYSEQLIVWCHKSCKSHLNYEFLTSVKVRCKMLSYGSSTYLPDSIGYVEQSCFTNIQANVTYPTWMMSSTVGIIHAKQLLLFKKIVNDRDFGYALTSIAKLGMAKGLLCDSEPRLLTGAKKNNAQLATVRSLFRFVKQHYRFSWMWLLFLDFILYEKQWPIGSLLGALFYRRRRFNQLIPHEFEPNPNAELKHPTLDVIIPTIGRKTYLYDVLKDLSLQTICPSTVVIVEQNPEPGSLSALDYLNTESWPFSIKHHFTHALGACNARNIALVEVTSEYVFLADDDIRLDKDLLENALATMNLYEAQAATLSCLQPDETETLTNVIQWHTFGSGCSIVRSPVLKKLKFDKSFEFGFGEDADFGMQLRHVGVDILYLPHCRLVHLKAPIGGFRTKVNFPWENDSILPKPSPTVMLFNLKHRNTKQLLGYKTTLFIKFFRVQPQFNILGYLKTMRHRWSRSVYWAQQLQQAHDND